MMNGILNINKPAGWTSHDVVAWVRRLLGLRRAGHAGTLDPMATGVLLVCVGQATRVAEYLMASPKAYRAEIRLGVTTDTYDADGQITDARDVPPLTQAEIVNALAPFIGEIQQAPPAYSAIKQGGVPLHRRARRGEVVTPEARPVRIHDIRPVSWQTPRLVVEIECDPGTYVRSLAHDLGQALGCGATLAGLVRTRSGRFQVADAWSTDALAEAVRAGELDRALQPMRVALEGLTPVIIDPDQERVLRYGQALPCNIQPATAIGCALSSNGEVVAILTYDAAARVWRPEKVFASND